MTIKTRHIYYLSGFDPRGIRFYASLFKEEALKYAAQENLTFNFSARKKISEHITRIEIYSPNCHTTLDFLHYDDWIRENWFRGFFEIIRNLFLYLKVYVFSHYPFKTLTFSPKQVITGGMPLWLTLIFILSCVLALKAYYISAALFLALGIYIAVQSQALWLLRIYNFCTLYSGQQIPNQHERIKHFSQHILAQEKSDEEIVIAHSVGSMLAVNVLAKTHLKPLNFICLGGVIPLVTLNKLSQWFKDDLLKVNRENLLWLDYASPIDGATFPLINPLIHCETKITPNIHVLSPRFHMLYSKKTYSKIKRNLMERHFLYLKTPEIPNGFHLPAMMFSSNPLKNWLNK